MIDLVLFSPVFALLLSELFKKLQLRFYVDEGSSVEFLVLAGVAGVFILIITVILQTLCLLYLNATPGKFLLKMRVYPVDSKSTKLTVTQAFLRSSLWALEWLFFGIPFLELFSDKRRRPLHDRAADTMVVTLKRGTLNAPFELESQFVRQMLLVTSFVFIFWGILIVGQFYRKAVRGDFRKAQLLESNYLCGSVSQSVGNGTRIDRAIALYLAGEVSSECLNSEADFILWSQLDSGKTWGYLAKMILKAGSSENEKDFFEKVCLVSNESEECQIAHAFKDEEPKILTSWQSETGFILVLMTEFRTGKYEKVLEDLKKLAEWKGFQEFAQKVRVKTYWSMNSQNKAIGAFEVARDVLNFENKLDIASWVCLEQMDVNCSGDKRPQSCQDVIDQAVTYVNQEGNQGPRVTGVKFPLETVLALLQEQECRGSSDSERSLFLGAFERYPEVQSYVKAIHANELPTVASNGQQRPSRFVKLEEVINLKGMRPALRERVLLSMISVARKTDEIEKVANLWETESKETWTSVKIAQKILNKAIELKTWAAAAKFADRIPDSMSAKYGLNDFRAFAYFQAGSEGKAWDLLKEKIPIKGISSERAPASIGEATKQNSGKIEANDLEQIKTELEKKFRK